jgi:hypothetical protein
MFEQLSCSRFQFPKDPASERLILGSSLCRGEEQLDMQLIRQVLKLLGPMDNVTVKDEPLWKARDSIRRLQGVRPRAVGRRIGAVLRWPPGSTGAGAGLETRQSTLTFSGEMGQRMITG